MKKSLLSLWLTPFFLGGCQRETVHDVDYYYEHFEECKKQVEKCLKNPGELDETPNCKNAKAAYHKRMMTGKRSFKMPVLTLK